MPHGHRPGIPCRQLPALTLQAVTSGHALTELPDAGTPVPEARSLTYGDPLGALQMLVKVAPHMRLSRLVG